MNSRVKLRWWLWTTFTLVVMVIAGLLGFPDVLAKSDATYLSFATIALYAACSAAMMVKVRQGAKNFEFLWRMTDTMQAMGFLGTLVGMVIAFQALSGFDLANIEGSKEALMNVVYGVMTAIYTTIVGLVGSEFLKIQINILETADAVS